MTSSTDTRADYYLTLGIRPDAELDEMRAAYRAKMRLWHPDLLSGAEDDVRQAATQMTSQLNEAYECLSDPQRRAVYDARRIDGATSTHHWPSAPRPRQATQRSRRPVRHVITTILGGVVAPLLGLTWASGLLPASPSANPSLIAALCVGVMTATIWLLTSSHLLQRPDRLSRIGVVWSHLMRWSGWALIGGCAIVVGIPVIAFALTVVFAAPFLGLILVAFVSSRSDHDGK